MMTSDGDRWIEWRGVSLPPLYHEDDDVYEARPSWWYRDGPTSRRAPMTFDEAYAIRSDPRRWAEAFGACADDTERAMFDAAMDFAFQKRWAEVAMGVRVAERKLDPDDDE